MISKGERSELRSIVKQQFRVLRSELGQRQFEMYAEVEHRINERYASADETWAGVQHEVQEAVFEANRRVNDALYNAGYAVKGDTERMFIGCRGIEQPVADRQQLRRTLHAEIDAQIKGALLRLEREEVDLLRTLAIGAIESDEAREFLAGIPTVGELVPAARLAELERSIGGDPL